MCPKLNKFHISAISLCIFLIGINYLHADSVNSPNITLNVDTNRSTGPGAGNVAVTINTITIAETTLPEYSSGSGKVITLKVKPGYQFLSSSNITVKSATIGFNGSAINTDAVITPTGNANEILTFNLTSGTNTSVQDIIRINGIKLKILSAEGAAGPTQTTMQLTTSTAGGAFTNQGIVAANITRGAADRLVFSIIPGTNQAGTNLFPQVKIVDFGGNVLINDTRAISLSIDNNPGLATLLGTTELIATSGIATWSNDQNLNITTAAVGYTLSATHDGSAMLSSDSTESSSFDITAGDPGSIEISTQPSDTLAGDPIILTVRTLDEFNNPTNVDGIPITLDSAINPGGWPLLTDSSTTKETVDGEASWTEDDNLRINKAISDYKLSASGLGTVIETDTFNILAALANSIRFIEHPSNTLLGEVIAPTVTTEVIDSFGNRINTSAEITLTLDSATCEAGLIGATANSTAGLATFENLAFEDRCSLTTLTATSDGLAGGVSNEFRITTEDEVPLSIATAKLKRGKQFKFSAGGTFNISNETINNPTKKGAILTVTGESGSVRYKLGKRDWQKLGSRGFKYSGPKCENVLLTNSSIKAVCNGRTGTITLPEEDLDIVLSVGKGTARFCGTCGGTASGDASKIFKRTACVAPEFCP